MLTGKTLFKDVYNENIAEFKTNFIEKLHEHLEEKLADKAIEIAREANELPEQFTQEEFQTIQEYVNNDKIDELDALTEDAFTAYDYMLLEELLTEGPIKSFKNWLQARRRNKLGTDVATAGANLVASKIASDPATQEQMRDAAANSVVSASKHFRADEDLPAAAKGLSKGTAKVMKKNVKPFIAKMKSKLAKAK